MDETATLSLPAGGSAAADAEDIRALCRRAEALFYGDRHAEAVDQAAAAFELAPDTDDILDFCAWLFIKIICHTKSLEQLTLTPICY